MGGNAGIGITGGLGGAMGGWRVETTQMHVTIELASGFGGQPLSPERVGTKLTN